MYVLKFRLDGDMHIPTALYMETTQENLLFCGDGELYEVLYNTLQAFEGTRLDGAFYDALECCDEGCWEAGNYGLTIVHSRGLDVGTVEDAFGTLIENELL